MSCDAGISRARWRCRDADSAGDFNDALAEGSVIAGTPDTVRAQIAQQAETIGFNYFIGYFMFGTMSLADARRSLRLFVSDVMPHFDEVSLARSR